VLRHAWRSLVAFAQRRPACRHSALANGAFIFFLHNKPVLTTSRWLPDFRLYAWQLPATLGTITAKRFCGVLEIRTHLLT